MSARFHELLGRWLLLDTTAEIEAADVQLAAPWAEQLGLLLWLLLGAAALAALWFYLRWQPGPRPQRLALAALRGAILMLVLLCLAEPTLLVRIVTTPRPVVWLLFDGSDSMAIIDELGPAEREQIDRALGRTPATAAHSTAAGSSSIAPLPPSRIDDVKALVTQAESQNVLLQLQQRFRLRAFLLDDAQSVRPLELVPSAMPLTGQSGNAAGQGNSGSRPTSVPSRHMSGTASSATGRFGDEPPLDTAHLARQLTTDAQVTALGAGLLDMQRRQTAAQLAGIVIVSDFDQNAGPAAVSVAEQLGVPIYALGIGPSDAVDLAVDLQTPLLMKKGELSSLVVALSQTGLSGQRAQLRVTSQRISETATAEPEEVVAERTIELDAPLRSIEVPYEPRETGSYLFAATVEPLAGEVVVQNNESRRQVNVRDDFLRLMFVENQPTWEWRFIKEVFHRDQLVGLRGFRTYLRTADPKVRQTNELFMPSLAPQRSEFFANDVIFLGDMPGAALSPRFCEMVREFVGEFGGGLVVIAGAQHGPGALADTPLADMLPVVVDPTASLRTGQEFTAQLTPAAAQFDFMRLGTTSEQNTLAWDNLGRLSWYQSALRVHPLATVLMQHPTDTCADNRTPQPLIAIRRYGRGEVVYLAFNETWRLRREFGETYYRQFWGQMIHRLGLSHALGSQKRFVVRSDRPHYRPDDEIVLSIEAYNQDFEPLTVDQLPQPTLTGELQLPTEATESRLDPRMSDELTGRMILSFTPRRAGLFECRLRLPTAGNYHVRAFDPLAGATADAVFEVTDTSVERRSAVRRVGLQEELAQRTGGRSFDLSTVHQLPESIKMISKAEATLRSVALWNTWPVFGLFVALLLSEWLIRKTIRLP